MKPFKFSDKTVVALNALTSKANATGSVTIPPELTDLVSKDIADATGWTPVSGDADYCRG